VGGLNGLEKTSGKGVGCGECVSENQKIISKGTGREPMEEKIK